MFCRISHHTILVASTIVLTAACASGRPQPDTTETLRLTPIDSAWSQHPWNAMADGIYTYRIEVASSTHRDTLSNVISPMPFLAGPSMVVGFLLDTVAEDRVSFRYEAGSRRPKRASLPSDIRYNFHDVALSPDGNYLLYLASDSVGNEWTSVRHWPDGEIVFTGPRQAACECDVDLHHARWISPDSFQVATRVGRPEWAVLTATLPGSGFHIDTVSGEPAWH